MQARNLYWVIATVLAAQGARFQLDKGLADGIRVDDTAAVFYTLMVESRPVRIEVGTARVVEIEENSALAEAADEAPIRPGYSMEFRLDAGRLSAAELLRLGNLNLEEGRPAVALSYFQKVDEKLPGDPLVARKMEQLGKFLSAAEEGSDKAESELEYYRLAADASWQEGDYRAVQSYVERILRIRPHDERAAEMAEAVQAKLSTESMLAIPAGSYPIGRAAGEAHFLNQQPRFEVRLVSFWIDASPIMSTEGPITGVSHGEAEALCREQGKRLPTEFEWEVAANLTDFRYSEGVSEWTASWYLPYPGNRWPEPEYGERFKVVRGFDQKGRFEPQMRFFMLPGERSTEVGFRCVLSKAPQ